MIDELVSEVENRSIDIIQKDNMDTSDNKN